MHCKRLYLNHFVFLFTILTLTTCTKKENLDVRNEEKVNIFQPNLVPLEIAQKIAESHGNVKELLDNKNVAAQRVIKEVITLGDTKMPSMYVFNYADDGFVILSAEQKFYPVLAYVPEGSYEVKNVPPAVKLWQDIVIEDIRSVREGKISFGDTIPWEWERLLDNIQAVDRSFMKTAGTTQTLGCGGTGGGSGPKKPLKVLDIYPKMFEKGPLLPSTWGQRCYYNALCPEKQGGDCGRALTGCVATAMAQVMRYYKSPANYDWNSMPTILFGENTEVARIMHDAGTAVDMDYGVSSSGAYHSDIDNALKENFGYKSANDLNYSYASVKSEINYNNPVILGGCSLNDSDDCHEWVCDGTLEAQYECYGSLMFHMNWGWNGGYNGWYQYNNWSTYIQGYGTVDYRKGLRMIVNIKP